MIYKSATTINQTVPVKPADTDSWCHYIGRSLSTP